MSRVVFDWVERLIGFDCRAPVTVTAHALPRECLILLAIAAPCYCYCYCRLFFVESDGLGLDCTLAVPLLSEVKTKKYQRMLGQCVTPDGPHALARCPAFHFAAHNVHRLRRGG